MLRNNVIANFLGQGWTAALGLAFVPLYVSYLGLEAYGLIGLFAVMSAWLSQFDVGMTPTLNREMARFRAGAHDPQSIGNLLRSLESICAFLAVLVFSLVWFGADYLSKSWIKPGESGPEVIARTLRVMAVVLALQFCESIYRGALLGLQKQVQFNAASAALASVRHGGAWIILAYVSSTVEAFFMWQALVAVFRVLTMAGLVYLTLPKTPKPASVSIVSIRSVMRFSAGMLAITTLSVLLMQMDKLLLSRLLPLDQFGMYTLATTAVGALSLMVSPVLQAIYPRLVELVAQKKDGPLAEMYHLTSQTVTVLAAPVVVIFVVFADGVLYAWTADVQIATSGRKLLAVLALGTFCNVLMRTPYMCMLAYGWTSLTIRVNIVAVALVVPALLAVVPRYGAVGAALTWFALNFGYICITVQLMHRRILGREKLNWYLSDVGLPFALALGLGGALAPLAPQGLASRAHWGLFLFIVGVITLCGAFLGAPSVRHASLKWFQERTGRAR